MVGVRRRSLCHWSDTSGRRRFQEQEMRMR
jgi:hypothetical protein